MVPEPSSPPPGNIATEEPIFFGLAVIVRPVTGKRRVRIRWLYLAAVLIGGGTVTYLLAALGLYFFFKLHRKFNDERYVDMLTLPFHWKEHDHAMGLYFLRMGDDYWANRHIGEAEQAFRLGLDKAPESIHARLMLSAMYFYPQLFPGQAEKGLKILELGIPYAITLGTQTEEPEKYNGPKYINEYLSQLANYQHLDKIATVCDQYLKPNLVDSKKDADVLITKVFALNLANVFIELGHYDQAEEAIKRFKLTGDIEGVILNAKLMWTRGNQQDAVNYLEELLANSGGKGPTIPDEGKSMIYVALSRYYVSLGDLQKATERIVLIEALAPSDIKPRIQLLYIDAKSGDKNKVETEANALTEQFQLNEPAMRLLANFATDQGDVPLAQRIFERAVENPKFDLAPFSLLLIEAHLASGDYPGALKFIEEIDQEHPAWLDSNKPVFDGLRAVADYGVGQTSQADAFLTGTLAENMLGADKLFAIASRFEPMGGWIEAHNLLEAAYKMDVKNQLVLTELVKVNLKLGDSAELGDNIKSLLGFNRPNLELLYDASRELGSDRFIFATNRESILEELDKYIQKNSPSHPASGA